MTTKSKILIVDNELDICNFVKSFFEPRGFEVQTAVNGDEAMTRLASFTPDLVILDVMMRTDTEGLDYLPKVKAVLPHAKVLMITGLNDDKSIALAKSMGADDYITKPLVLENLENTVMNKLKSLKK